MQKIGMENRNKDDLALNVLKGLAMFLVVFYHFQKYWFHNNFSESGGKIFYYLLSFTSLGVPVFFYINGALLLNKESVDWKNWAKKIAGIFGMTLLWSVLIEIFQFWYNQYDEWENFWEYVYTGKYLNYLWFIKSLLAIYMLFPILWMAYRNMNNVYLGKYGMLISVFFILVGAFGNNLLLMIANIIKYFTEGELLSSNGTYGFFDKFLTDFRGGGYMFPIAYFIIGGMLYKKKEKIRSRKWWLLSVLIVAMLILSGYGYLCTIALGTEEWYNVSGNSYSSIIVAISTICLVFLFQEIQIKNRFVVKYLSVLGRNTLGIYFIHIPIGYSLIRLLRKSFRITCWGIFYAIIFSIVVLNLSLLSTVIFKRVRGLMKKFLEILVHKEKHV